jgi:hypothetical protein
MFRRAELPDGVSAKIDYAAVRAVPSARLSDREAPIVLFRVVSVNGRRAPIGGSMLVWRRQRTFVRPPRPPLF